MHATAAFSLNTPGLSILAAFERAGLIRRVTPLSNDVVSSGMGIAARPALAAMFAGPAVAAAGDAHAGVSLVELERDLDVGQIQLELSRDPHVENVSRVPVRYLLAKRAAPRRTRRKAPPTVAAVPPAASTLWNMRAIKWSEARSLPGFRDADDVLLAVLDSGIDPNHPELKRAGLIVDYVYSHPTSAASSSDFDYIGHGTHVSGTIAADINNHIGINGICNCKLHMWKIFDDVPDYDSFHNEFVYFVEPVMYRRALQQCIDGGIQVINLSIGGGGVPDFVEQQLFDTLISRGVIVVAAMGNEAQGTFPGIISYPAAISGVIAVGATAIDDTRADFSNYKGNHIALCAPGVGIWSTLPTYAGQFGFAAGPGPGGSHVPTTPQRRETDYDAWNGTSMATPHVTAAAALLIARDGAMNAATAKDRLQQTADKVAGMHGQTWTREYGSGRLNLLRLLS